MQKDEYDQHNIWSTLSAAETALLEFSDKAKEDPRFRELDKRIGYLRWLLGQSDHALISNADLQQVQNNISDILNHLPNNANNFGHLGNIENWFSNALSRLPYPRVQKIFRSDANEAIDEIIESLSVHKSVLDTYAKDFQRRSDSALAQIKRIDEEINSAKGEMDKVQARLSTSMENIEARLDTKVTERLNEISDRFSQSQNERSATFQNLEDEMKGSVSEIRDQLKSIKVEIEQEFSKTKSTLETALLNQEKLAKQSVSKIEALYDQAGRDVLAADFAGNAASEGASYRFNSILASLMFVLSAVSLGIIWWSLLEEGTLTFVEILKRLPISALFLLPAFYFSALASNHIKSSVKLRSLGLRIKAFDAYIASTGDVGAQKLKVEMAQEFFAEKVEATNRPSLFSRSPEKSIDRVADLAEKIIEKVPGSHP